MKKETKNKVGRPKLADSKLKRESLIVSLSVLFVCVIISAIAYKIITIDFDPKYAVGTIYNTHPTSCIVNNNMIDCGPSVTYLKYKIDDNDYIEVNKDYKSIKVTLNNYKKLKYCYKTNNTDLICK